MMKPKSHSYDQVVYLLQGGGALGSYQVGVTEALLENGYAPDWVVGTSIGSINACIIAGNKPDDRIAKLNEFWTTIASPFPNSFLAIENDFIQEFTNALSANWTIFVGQPGFFRPRVINPWSITRDTPDHISYYDTSELADTLRKVINFDLINQQKIRVTLGAVNLKTGQSARFDNSRQTIGPEHIMASAALPPGFPAIRIGDDYFWDGGISSNTPFEAVIEEKNPKKLLCFIVNLFSYRNHLPTSMLDILKFKKDFAYASHHQELLHHFCEVFEFTHTLRSLAQSVTHNKDLDEVLAEIDQIGHPTSLNLIRLHYRNRPSDLWSEDFDFSPQILNQHRVSGYLDATHALEHSAWFTDVPDHACSIIHEI